jgi:hypothetical protein
MAYVWASLARVKAIWRAHATANGKVLVMVTSTGLVTVHVTVTLLVHVREPLMVILRELAMAQVMAPSTAHATAPSSAWLAIARANVTVTPLRK